MGNAGLTLVKQGAQNRRNAATKLNLDSSRSHSVFTIELVAPSSSSSSDERVGYDDGRCVFLVWVAVAVGRSGG